MLPVSLSFKISDLELQIHTNPINKNNLQEIISILSNEIQFYSENIQIIHSIIGKLLFMMYSYCIDILTIDKFEYL